MLKGISRARLVGAWFAAVGVMIATRVVSGATITISSGGLWLAACVVPPAVMLIVWRGASPVTLAALLHSRQQTLKGNSPMITTRTLVIVALGLVLSTHALQAQDRSRYRDFKLGSDLPSVSALASVRASEAKTIHQRPAVMQELTWRLPYIVSRSTASQNDPVRQIVFSFYNDQLSKIVVDYDHDRTLGMSDGDMIEAISTTYGLAWIPTVNKSRAVTSQVEAESGTPVARWGDTDVSVVLYRSSDLYGSSSASRFRLIVTSPRLEALAKTGDAQAIRLDASEAPQREIARQKKQVEDTRVAEEKARIANKAAFRP